VTQAGPDNQATQRGAGSVPCARILVVEDNPDGLDTLTVLLRTVGYEVRGCQTGLGALAELDRFKPEAVLLDISLPDTTGYDVAREIRKQYGENRPLLVAITAWGDPPDQILAKMAGFNYHFQKPWEPRALLDLLAQRLPSP
jgi:DNA-binding response OmpR family regulator